MLWTRRAPASTPLLRFSIRPAAGVTLTGSLAVAPEGKRVVYSARRGSSDPQLLWLQSLDAFDGRAFPGTENGANPFWSPDGKHLGFFADRKLKILDIESGSIDVVGDVADGATGGSWGADGVILVGASFGGLTKLSASGGPTTTATTPDAHRNEASHLALPSCPMGAISPIRSPPAIASLSARSTQPTEPSW